MIVENENIILDDEIISLANVTHIDVTQSGSPFDNSRLFYITICCVDGAYKTVEYTGCKTKTHSFIKLNELGKQIIKQGNTNFAQLDFVLINMDYINQIKYNKTNGTLSMNTTLNNVVSFLSSPYKAEKTIEEFDKMVRKYDQSNTDTL